MFAPPHEHRNAREQFSAHPSTMTAVAQPEQGYYSHYQLGNHFKQSGNPIQAQIEYQAAIREVEHLRAQCVIDQRAHFLLDKQKLYEEMVDLCLSLQQPAEALAYAEMVKSRTLHDLLAMQMDLDTQVQNPANKSWVATLRNLRQFHAQLVESYQEPTQSTIRGGIVAQSQPAAIQRVITYFEQRITTLWQNLVARNVGHLPKTVSPPIPVLAVQTCLQPDTALVEYFVIQEKLIAFVVTPDQVYAQRLPITLAQVQRLLRFLQLNLKTVTHSAPEHLENLTHNAQQLLAQLYDGLFVPVQERLAPYQQLIIVPHGPLHQLPFHALHDGQAYLVERYAVNYLPCASLLPYCTQTHPQRPPKEATAVALGYSAGGRLPHAVTEAKQVAALTQGEAFLEETATIARLRQVAATCRLLHLSTHGNFRDDNPLFSGLALADGWLTSLDIFEMRLRASLVTLSACQTGRHVIGGGDELLGLIRALLATGTATVVGGLWAVEDRATACLMSCFYGKLAAGSTKGEALRYAQLALLKGDHEAGAKADAPYRHPYFWAPFFLMGDAGAL